MTTQHSEFVVLSNNIHNAQYVEASNFPPVIHRKRTEDSELFVWVRPLNPNTGKNEYISGFMHKPADYKIKGQENMYGRYHIEFDELQNGEWIVIFKSELILQSKYLKMTSEEGKKILNNIIDNRNY